MAHLLGAGQARATACGPLHRVRELSEALQSIRSRILVTGVFTAPDSIIRSSQILASKIPPLAALASGQTLRSLAIRGSARMARSSAAQHSGEMDSAPGLSIAPASMISIASAVSDLATVISTISVSAASDLVGDASGGVASAGVLGLGFNSGWSGWGWGGYWGAYPYWGVGYYDPWWGWPYYGYYAPPAVNYNVTPLAPYSSSDSTDSSSTY
jgi:hypothetical protein